MALKFKYQRREEIPVEHLPFYAEREGAWVLDVDGAMDAGKVDEAEKRAHALERERDALSMRLAEIQIDQGAVAAARKRGLRATAWVAGFDRDVLLRIGASSAWVKKS